MTTLTADFRALVDAAQDIRQALRLARYREAQAADQVEEVDA